MKAKYEAINNETDDRTGLIYKTVAAAKCAATKHGWKDIKVSDGYNILFTTKKEDTK